MKRTDRISFNSFKLCVSLVVLITTAVFSVACSRGTADSERQDKLIIYAYDSFASDWVIGPEAVRLFSEKTGYKVELVAVGDAGQVLSRAMLEKRKPRADVLVGIDNNLLPKARAAGVLESWKGESSSLVPAQFVLSDDWLLTPYDWGSFALIFDTASGLRPPESLEDLTSSEYTGRLILMDPRTSTPGLGFLAWTMAVYGDAWKDYWTRLKPSILTMAPGWDTGYGLFTSGEAPLVISYTTSPAYHVEYDQTDRYQALIFAEGHVSQIEGLGVVAGAPNRTAAREFVDFMLGEEVQSILPLRQWMYPVLPGVSLPASYDAAPQPEKQLSVSVSALEPAVAELQSVLGR